MIEGHAVHLVVGAAAGAAGAAGAAVVEAGLSFSAISILAPVFPHSKPFSPVLAPAATPKQRSISMPRCQDPRNRTSCPGRSVSAQPSIQNLHMLPGALKICGLWLQGLPGCGVGYSARQRCAGQKESEQRSGSGCRSRSSSPTPPSPLPPRHTRWCINARARARGAHSPNKMASDSFRGGGGGSGVVSGNHQERTL